jgi:ATP-dependent Clp protease ATP-binding subunit ClpB
MTSNVGSQVIQELGGGQPEEMEKRVLEALRRQFKPEFINRIDDIIIFHNLSPKELEEIVDIQTQRLCRRLQELDVQLTLSAGAKAFLSQKGYDPIYGARPLKRVIQKYIENPLSLEILKGEIADGSLIEVTVGDDQIHFVVK